MKALGVLSGVVVLLIVTLALTGCSGEPKTGPGEVHWDRDTCVRCIMAVSDHHYSAQVRGGPAAGKTRLSFFDDIGCAVLWLEQQPWREDPRTEMWVNDHTTGAWIDAFKAFYVTGKVTPMDYGLGAQIEQTPDALDYQQAVQEIHDREDRLH